MASMTQRQQQLDNYQMYYRTGLLGALRGFAGLPFEHPFDVLKTRMQANFNIPKKYKGLIEYQELQSAGMIKNWIQIYKQQGFFKGVYAGYVPSLVRVMSKQFYRFPMMAFFPEMFKNMMPQTWMQKNNSLHKVATGLLIACIETVIICPLERMKVFLMTKQQQSSSLSQLLKNGSKSLYQGVDALFYRQIVSWVSFLYLDDKVKKAFKDYRGIAYNQALGTQDLIIGSILIGVGNVFVVQPFDKMKTVCQMSGNEKFVQNSMVQNIKTLVKDQGFKGLYTGIRPRMVHYVINSMFTSTILEQIEMSVVNRQQI